MRHRRPAHESVRRGRGRTPGAGIPSHSVSLVLVYHRTVCHCAGRHNRSKPHHAQISRDHRRADRLRRHSFAVLGRMIRAMCAAVLDQAEHDAFREEATAGDYDHLLRTRT